MRLKKLALVAVSAVMLLAVAACGKKKDTFKVGFDQNFPPYGFVGEDGEYTGFDIEMAKACADKMGKEIELIPIDWDAKDMELEAGNIDCIWNGFTINGREDGYTWSEPYMNNAQVVIVKADSGIDSISQLADKTVEVQTDSSAQAALEDEANAELAASFKELVKVGEYNTALMDLESGAVDAVILDEGVGAYQIKGKEDTFKMLDGSIADEQYAIGFNKGNEEMRDTVQAALKELVKDGTFAKISNEWFGKDVCILK
ncbi:MAG: amino acid ABC transporter substrate-binding protein [Lachnospiraceae bacterium]|nr:amino acid ABC transporter substrate-binding protein [Lachnospiraceae bacterium]